MIRIELDEPTLARTRIAISPLGPLFGDETPKSDWLGYRYRILEAQGPSAPGGKYAYTLGDNMSRGFAAIAWLRRST